MASPNALSADEAAAIKASRKSPGWFHSCSRFLGIALFFGGWQLVSEVVLPWIDMNLVTLMPPPTSVLLAAWELIQSGELFKHFRASVKREAIAFIYA